MTEPIDNPPSDHPRLVFLGTASGMPTRTRGVSSIALVLRGGKEVWLFDCGEGTQRQLLACNLSPASVRVIFLTHMHGDHVLGLVPLLSTMGLAHDSPPPLLFAPSGCSELLKVSARACHIPSLVDFPVQELHVGGVHADSRARVHCLPVPHRIPAFAFRVGFVAPPPNIDSEKLREREVPHGPWLADLKRGLAATLPDGRRLEPSEFLLPSPVPHSFAITGDTEGSPNLTDFVTRAHTLVHESTFSSQHHENARTWSHSTALQAAQRAVDAQVGRLILTHFSARYSSEDLRSMLEEARMIFPNSHLASDGASFTMTTHHQPGR